MERLTVKCPSCGSEEIISEPEPYDEFANVVCSRCRRRITRDDIEKQAASLLEKRLTDILKKR